MIRHATHTAMFFLLVALLTIQPVAAQDWVERSNANTRLLIDMEAGFSPEGAAINGIAEYDGLVSDLGPNLVDRKIAASESLLARYRGMLGDESDTLVKQDLEILISKLEMDIEGGNLQKKYSLAWTDVPKLVFGVTAAMLSEQIQPARRSKVLELIQRYTGLYPESTSIFAQAKAQWTESQGKDKIGPYRGELDDALAKFDTYAAGIRQLFVRFDIAEADTALDELDRQIADYGEWARLNVLPATRENFRLPPELYAFLLKRVGIDIDPEILMDRAKVEFFETRETMAMLANQVADKSDLQDSDYRAVIKALKQRSISDDELVETYTGVLADIEDKIAEHHIVTLPDYQVKMRLASQAESAAQPAPHMQPPPLIGNTGQQGEFILPVGVPSADGSQQSYDDFNFEAATWTLSAHEGRPGHELQFAAMIDRGVSQARALYAFNSVNVEGWALYAEAEMVEYEPIEGQLIAMQHRLLRAARAFLDPMLNLGMISRESAAKILAEDVVLSPAMVKQELDRYTFNNPGQAASYFYGYTRLLNLRMSTELSLGDKFDRLAFNDFVLGLGLLPPDQIAEAVEQEFIPSQELKDMKSD